MRGIARPPDLAALIAVVLANARNGAPLAQLAGAARVATDLELSADALVGYFVERCRDEGLTWSQISSALGVSRQAVHKRFALAGGGGAAPPRHGEPSPGELAFDAACRSAIEEVERLGFHPGGWIGLIEEHGAVAAARRLLDRPSPLPVFQFLVGSNRSQLSLEALAVREEHALLFEESQRAEAKRRLEAAGVGAPEDG